MDASQIQHAAAVAGEALAFASLCLTALLSAAGTLRNLASHANFISVEERGKIGAVLDRFALVCEKGKKGLAWVLSLPGFASRDKGAQPPDLKALVVLPLLLALALQGCATASTPPGATLAQKATADVVLVGQIANDVKAKCGPEFAGLGPVILAALQIAASPQDVLSDIMAVVQAAPTIYKDGQAIACAVRTVIDDLRAAAPKPGSAAWMQVETLEQVALLLEPGAAQALQCASSPPSR